MVLNRPFYSRTRATPPRPASPLGYTPTGRTRGHTAPEVTTRNRLGIGSSLPRRDEPLTRPCWLGRTRRSVLPYRRAATADLQRYPEGSTRPSAPRTAKTWLWIGIFVWLHRPRGRFEQGGVETPGAWAGAQRPGGASITTTAPPAEIRMRPSSRRTRSGCTPMPTGAWSSSSRLSAL